jgi:hypothetical protein
MNIGRSPELTVLLMTCVIDLSPEKKIQLSQLLSQNQLDWDLLYTLADRHRITPFLYRILQNLADVPTKFLAKLHHECRMLATENLLKLNEYHRVVKLFEDHGIEHMAFKGVYLAENNYPDSSLRSIGDFDILVAKNSLFKVIHILESDSYKLGKEYTHYLQHSGNTLLNDLHEVSLFKPFFKTSYFNIDLHWEIECFTRYYASFYLSDIIYPPALIKEHQVILLVVHHGVVNIWQHVVYINDLYFSLKDEETNWPRLLQELRQYGLENVFLAGVYWCQQLWDLALPPSIQELIDTKQVRSLAEAYEKNWEAEQSVLTVNPGLRQITLFTNAQTKFTKKLKIYVAYVSSFIFRSSLIRIGKNRFYIPRQLGFLTVFFRIIHGIYKSLSNS